MATSGPPNEMGPGVKGKTFEMYIDADPYYLFPAGYCSRYRIVGLISTEQLCCRVRSKPNGRAPYSQ